MKTAGIRFNKERVENGLRLAMSVGMPPDEELRPRFVILENQPSPFEDENGVPFDPKQMVTAPVTREVTGVLCGIEYVDRPGEQVDWTQIIPSEIVLTMLQEEYELVRGFDHVFVGGEKFRYNKERTPLGLVTIQVHQFEVVAEDDA